MQQDRGTYRGLCFDGFQAAALHGSREADTCQSRLGWGDQIGLRRQRILSLRGWHGRTCHLPRPRSGRIGPIDLCRTRASNDSCTGTVRRRGQIRQRRCRILDQGYFGKNDAARHSNRMPGEFRIINRRLIIALPILLAEHRFSCAAPGHFAVVRGRAA